MADVTFEFQIPNLPVLMAAFAQAPAIVGPILQKYVSASQAVLAKNTGQNTPYASGALIQSFLFQQSGLQASWSPKVNYALFVEQGTGIYGPTGARIVPKTAKALWWPSAAHPVRSIAGMQGRHYMEKILESATPELTELFSQCGDDIAVAIQKSGS